MGVTCKKKKSVVRSVCEKVSDSVARTIYLEPIKIESCDISYIMGPICYRTSTLHGLSKNIHVYLRMSLVVC